MALGHGPPHSLNSRAALDTGPSVRDLWDSTPINRSVYEKVRRALANVRAPKLMP